jgi:hypothetical protein
MNSVLGTSLRERIGNTPLLRFERVTEGLNGVQVLAKAEWANPGGSVKDRAASNIVAEALRAGKLGAGKTLLDSTSGNTGIAYAMLGAAYGIPITLVHALECIGGAEANSSGVWRNDRLYRSRRRLRWRDPQGAGDGCGNEPDTVLLRRSIFQRRQLARALRQRNRR